MDMIDIENAIGTEDYDDIQEYMEEYSHNMNESKFGKRNERVSLSDRLFNERALDVFEMEGEIGWSEEEED